jgi:hypothetical protein
VGGEAERTYEQRDVGHAAADAEETGEEADDEAVGGPASDGDGVPVGLAASIDDRALFDVAARFR